MPKLIMMRHGASIWNELNLFTGWVDIPLSAQGIQEAIQAGKQLASLPFDIVFSSALIRAITTALYVIKENNHRNIAQLIHPETENMGRLGKVYSEETKKTLLPIHTAWQLNERMYGELQGLNKDETRKHFGEEQVLLWRRSFREAPPGGESLEMTCKRTLPYFHSTIVPHLEQGKNVFISAHGNSLRSIIMEIDKMTEDEILHFELPTGKPVIYEFEPGGRYIHRND